jgi:hypothetical protein
MPTTRPRYPITATDEVTEALKVAAQRWPEEKDNPRALLLRLIHEGVVAVRHSDRATARREAVARTSGAFSDVYGPGYLDDLREDWPA